MRGLTVTGSLAAADGAGFLAGYAVAVACLGLVEWYERKLRRGVAVKDDAREDELLISIQTDPGRTAYVAVAWLASDPATTVTLGYLSGAVRQMDPALYERWVNIMADYARAYVAKGGYTLKSFTSTTDLTA